MVAGNAYRHLRGNTDAVRMRCPLSLCSNRSPAPEYTAFRCVLSMRLGCCRAFLTVACGMPRWRLSAGRLRNPAAGQRSGRGGRLQADQRPAGADQPGLLRDQRRARHATPAAGRGGLPLRRARRGAPAVHNVLANSRARSVHQRHAAGQAAPGRRHPDALPDQHHGRASAASSTWPTAGAIRRTTPISASPWRCGACGDGPFLFLPVLGPSNPRDAAGFGVDIALDPLTWVGFGGIARLGWSRYGLGAVDARERVLDTSTRSRRRRSTPTPRSAACIASTGSRQIEEPGTTTAPRCRPGSRIPDHNTPEATERVAASHADPTRCSSPAPPLTVCPRGRAAGPGPKAPTRRPPSSSSSATR